MKRFKFLFIAFILFLSFNVKAVQVKSYVLGYSFFPTFDNSTELLNGNTPKGQFTLVDAYNHPFRFWYGLNYNFIAGKTYSITSNFCIPVNFNYITFNAGVANFIYGHSGTVLLNNRNITSDASSKCLNFNLKLTFDKNVSYMEFGQMNNDVDTVPWTLSSAPFLPAEVYGLPVVWHSLYIDEIQNANDILNARLDGVIGSVQTKDRNDERRHKEAQNSRNEAEKTRKGILKTIIELPKKIVNLIVDGLKSLFIPKDGFIKDKFNELFTFISDKLGILFYPFELISDFFKMIVDFCIPGDGILDIPSIKEPFSGVVLIQATSYNFGKDFKASLGEYYGLYQSIIYGICILLFCKFIYNYYRYIMEGKQ